MKAIKIPEDHKITRLRTHEVLARIAERALVVHEQIRIQLEADAPRHRACRHLSTD